MSVDFSQARVVVDGVETVEPREAGAARVMATVSGAPGCEAMSIRQWNDALRRYLMTKDHIDVVSHFANQALNDARRERDQARAANAMIITERDSAKNEAADAQHTIQQAHVAFGEAFNDPTATIQQKAAEAAKVQAAFDALRQDFTNVVRQRDAAVARVADLERRSDGGSAVTAAVRNALTRAGMSTDATLTDAIDSLRVERDAASAAHKALAAELGKRLRDALRVIP